MDSSLSLKELNADQYTSPQVDVDSSPEAELPNDEITMAITIKTKEQAWEYLKDDKIDFFQFLQCLVQLCIGNGPYESEINAQNHEVVKQALEKAIKGLEEAPNDEMRAKLLLAKMADGKPAIRKYAEFASHNPELFGDDFEKILKFANNALSCDEKKNLLTEKYPSSYKIKDHDTRECELTFLDYCVIMFRPDEGKEQYVLSPEGKEKCKNSKISSELRKMAESVHTGNELKRYYRESHENCIAAVGRFFNAGDRARIDAFFPEGTALANKFAPQKKEDSSSSDYYEQQEFLHNLERANMDSVVDSLLHSVGEEKLMESMAADPADEKVTRRHPGKLNLLHFALLERGRNSSEYMRARAFFEKLGEKTGDPRWAEGIAKIEALPDTGYDISEDKAALLQIETNTVARWESGSSSAKFGQNANDRNYGKWGIGIMGFRQLAHLSKTSLHTAIIATNDISAATVKTVLEKNKNIKKIIFEKSAFEGRSELTKEDVDHLHTQFPEVAFEISSF